MENAVGYVKKNFLNGLELTDFSAINPAARLWLDSVANVRIHSQTRQRPIDMFETEKAHLLPKNPATYDIARISTVRVSKQFRVAFDANHYSVPVDYAGGIVTLKAYPERLCIYHDEQLIARHDRCHDRHRDKENPDHPKVLIAQRRNANAQRLLLRFLALTPKAPEYHAGLMARRLNWRNHVAKINALADIYGDAATGRAIEDGLAFDAFSCEYITNLLDARARAPIPPACMVIPALFTTAINIINSLSAAQASGGIKREMNKYLRPSILVIDELGYLPIDKFGADCLYQIISARYVRSCTIVTTNRVPKNSAEIFNNDSALTSALLERLLHHAETCSLKGKVTG